MSRLQGKGVGVGSLSESVPPGARARAEAERDEETSPSQESTAEVNSIRQSRRRQRMAFASGVGKNPAAASVSQNSAERPQIRDPSHAVPDGFHDRYVRAGRQVHFLNGQPAFTDDGTRLRTRLENPEVIRDLVAIAQTREWDRIVVRGTQHFRREAWFQAQRVGLPVSGYRPSEIDRALLARQVGGDQVHERSEAHPNASESRSETERPQPKKAPPLATSSPDLTADHLHRGILIDHGADHHQFDRRQDTSYFVRLDTTEGPVTVWGRDLERALKHSLSRATAGDEVVVRQLGARALAVLRDQRDENGRRLAEAKLPAHLNRWSIERSDFLRDREALAHVVRDARTDAPAATARHPELAGTYTELQVAKRVAQDLYAHPADQERFVTRVREAIADEIERGE